MRPTTRTIAMLGATLALATGAGAQQRAAVFEVRPFVGAFVPTGDNRDLFDDAVLVGASAAYRVHEYVAVIGTFGWAPTSLKGLPSGIAKDDVDLFQYDLGVQISQPFALSAAWSITPLVGLGAGARTYDLREEGVETETDVNAYTAVGAEVSRGRIGLRLTARHYVTAMEQYEEGKTGKMARHDLAFGAGLSIRF